MKKFRINSILFVFAAVFIITGIWGECFVQIKHAVKVMYKDLKKGNVQSILDFKATVDDVSSEQLSYHDIMMDIDSVKNNLLGTRVVRKDDETVVKADSGCLMETVIKLRASDIEDVVDRIRMLKEVAEENNVPFLYCGVPRKEVIEKGPENITNYSLENYERFISGLEESDIPVLDFKNLIQEKNDAGQNPYYSTDLHWKAAIGFLAAAEICEELSSRYGFKFNKKYTDINVIKLV